MRHLVKIARHLVNIVRHLVQIARHLNKWPELSFLNLFFQDYPIFRA